MKAKKSLGQNFLKDINALKSIVRAGNVSEKDTILEIGPGKGALTKKLLETGADIFAIEKDRELIPILQETFSKEIKNNKLNLIEGDVLSIETEKIIQKPFKVIANIPYYITGEILKKFLEKEKNILEIVLLVQKEVAKRITDPKKESILSLSVKIFGTPKYIDTVKAKSFSPVPKVDSAIIKITPYKERKLTTENEVLFFEFIKTSFASKRKTLVNNLSKQFPKNEIISLLEKIDLNEKIRPEDISFDNWFKLFENLY